MLYLSPPDVILIVPQTTYTTSLPATYKYKFKPIQDLTKKLRSIFSQKFRSKKGQKLRFFPFILKFAFASLKQKQEIEIISSNDRLYTTSLDIARVFEKRHADILRDIKDLPKDNFSKRNFALADYIDSQGKSRPYYNLTRDGFALLVMGFTGDK